MGTQETSYIKESSKRQWLIPGLFLLLALIGLGVGFYYYNQYQNVQATLKNPNLVVEQQTQAVVEQVKKLMVLPTNEIPTIATVTDTSKIKSQLFFQDATNGDKILIYIKARKAILFDPAKNIIVNVAPLNITENQPQQVGSSSTPTGRPIPTVLSPSPVRVSPTPGK